MVSYRTTTRLFFLLTLVLSGCATVDQYDDLVTVDVKPQQTANRAHQSPKLAIAFGGGAARGVMHLGVIKALEEQGIEADIVTGTSVGSIAAVLYATHDYEQIAEILYEFSEHQIVDLNLSNKGLIKGQALARWVNQHTGNRNLSELPVTTGIVATNLSQQKAVMFVDGNLGEAVQTSSSVPGVFVPIYHHDDILVDGGVLSLVPVYGARQLGADIVIGVDVFCSAPPPLKYKAANTVANSFWIQSCIATKDEIETADIVVELNPIEPSLIEFGHLEEREQAMQIGYDAMMAAMPELLRQYRK